MTAISILGRVCPTLIYQWHVSIPLQIIYLTGVTMILQMCDLLYLESLKNEVSRTIQPFMLLEMCCMSLVELGMNSQKQNQHFLFIISYDHAYWWNRLGVILFYFTCNLEPKLESFSNIRLGTNLPYDISSVATH